MSDRFKGVLLLAAPCVGIGGVLLQQGFRRMGWAFVSLAGLFVAVGLLSFLIPSLFHLLKFISDSVQRLIRRALDLARQAYRRFLMRLLEPVFSGIARNAPLSWTASQKKVYTSAQAADYMLLTAADGQTLRGLEFTLRPDYRYQYWRAGFKLGPGDEEFEKGHIADTCLFHIAMDSVVTQAHALLFLNRTVLQDTGLLFFAKEVPAFVVRVNVWPTGNTVARMAVSVDNAGSNPLVTSFDIRYTQRAVLLAWADGKPFKIHFDDIKVFWDTASG